jgi:hypothetical protein
MCFFFEKKRKHDENVEGFVYKILSNKILKKKSPTEND